MTAMTAAHSTGVKLSLLHYRTHSSADPSPGLLVQSALRLVDAAIERKGWVNVNRSRAGEQRQAISNECIYLYKLDPPRDLTHRQDRSTGSGLLREWDTSTSFFPIPDEEYRICELDEFQSTNFDDIFDISPSTREFSSSHPDEALYTNNISRDDDWDFLYGEPVTKKRKFERQSLQGVIDEPAVGILSRIRCTLLRLRSAVLASAPANPLLSSSRRLSQALFKGASSAHSPILGVKNGRLSQRPLGTRSMDCTHSR
jgi:hypothetical protein